MSTTDLRDFLKSVILFHDLPAKEMDKVAKLFHEKSFPKYQEIFGEMGVLGDEGRSANAETLTDVKTAVISREDFQGLVEKNPSISLHIIRTLITRLIQADRQIKNLALGNSRAKIADILLQLSSEFGGDNT